jgi:hypothetical protein
VEPRTRTAPAPRAVASAGARATPADPFRETSDLPE